MENMSLADVKKQWRVHVVSMGSIPDARCYKEHMKAICQALTTAFAPSDDPAVISRGEDSADGDVKDIEPTIPKQGNDAKSSDPESTNGALAADEQIVLKQTAEKEDIVERGSKIRGDSNKAFAKGIAETQDAEMQIVEEQSPSASKQSADKIDDATVTISEPADDTEKLSECASMAGSASDRVAVIELPSSSPAIEAVPPPFYLTPLQPTYAELRALFVDLLYNDRFVLLGSPPFLKFLTDQPQLSHSFLQYLIHHRFGIRYVHRDGGNANHGIVPFRFPFQPVRRDLPLSLYYDNRWALLNDSAWVEWASKEKVTTPWFWSELSSHGGLGVMQRRPGRGEREYTSAIWLL